MTTPAETFRELHRLHRHARDLKAEIDKGPRLMKQQQAKLAKHETALTEAKDALKKLKVTVHDKETTLKATHQQIAKYEKQRETAGSKKEYDAFQTEIGHARDKCGVLEDEILTAMGEIEERTAALPGVEKALADVKAETAGFEKEAKERLARLQNDLQLTQAAVTEAEKGIPESLQSIYTKQITTYGADAIAIVKDRVCMHCHASLNAQHLRELEAGNVRPCQNCGRLIFV